MASPYEQLEQLGKLKEQGLLSQEEFNEQKVKLISPGTDNVIAKTQNHELPNEALWNPEAAAKWSLLFSPLFGILLHSINWHTLGDKKSCIKSWCWALGYIIGAFIFPLKGYYLGFVIVWYIFSAKSQIKFIKNNYGTTYKRRGWAAPICIAVGVTTILVILIVIANEQL